MEPVSKSGLWGEGLHIIAGVAQLVERNVAIVEVAGSSPVSRSSFAERVRLAAGTNQ